MRYYLFLIIILFNFSLNHPQIPADYEIAPWHAWKQGAITYSFDDGCKGN